MVAWTSRATVSTLTKISCVTRCSVSSAGRPQVMLLPGSAGWGVAALLEPVYDPGRVVALRPSAPVPFQTL